MEKMKGMMFMEETFIEKMRSIYVNNNDKMKALSEIEDAIKIEKQYSNICFEDVVKKIGVAKGDIKSYSLKREIEEL